MNKKLFIGGCGLAAIAGNVFAADEEYSYFTPCVALKGGYSLLGKRNDIKYKGGFAGAVEMGFSYDAWRFGVEVGYRSNKIKEFKPQGGFEGTNYILNGKFDMAHAAVDVHDHAHGVAAANYIATDNPSVYKVGDGNNNAQLGIGAIGIDAAEWVRVKGGIYAQDDRGLMLRNASYLKFEKMNTLSGMFNVCYDYAMTDAWSIYGGIGLGVARVNYTVTEGNNGGVKLVAVRGQAGGDYTEAEAKALVLEKLPGFLDGKLHKTEYSKTVFAWQFMAGVAYELSENLKLTFGYKLFNTARVKQNFAGKDYKIKTPFNHTAEAGFVLSF